MEDAIELLKFRAYKTQEKLTHFDIKNGFQITSELRAEREVLEGRVIEANEILTMLENHKSIRDFKVID